MLSFYSIHVIYDNGMMLGLDLFFYVSGLLLMTLNTIIN